MRDSGCSDASGCGRDTDEWRSIEGESVKFVATARNINTFFGLDDCTAFSEQGNVLYCLPDGQNLSKVEVIIIDLCNKDGSEGFVESCAIHVYGSADR